ncbi:MAG: chloride channel protein [Beijerinckiaceae bacterium]|nr:chloride channel protein [Beijerinckiaceae bacterium]
MSFSETSAPLAKPGNWRFGFIWLRALIRQSEAGLIVLSILAGAIAGAGVTLLSIGTRLLHIWFYGLDARGELSALSALHSPWHALIPLAGGLALGVTGRLVLRWRPRRPIDAIEANALYGGRMSVGDSLLIAAQTLVSNGAGASVGLEAAYTQLGSGFASRIGSTFKLRRADMRTLVGAGAAGAISAAFGAPLTGAFYAFELIIASYTPFGLAPVIAAAITGRLVAQQFGIGESFIGHLASSVTLEGGVIAATLVLALICAALGITIMRLVTVVEDLFKRSRLPAFLQPAIGGLALGAMALVTPHILSAGHGALSELLHGARPALAVLATALCLKVLASAVSIGSGFRGGLFFASLYLGALTGKIFFGLILMVDPSFPLSDTACAIIAMTALSAAVIGGPLTMSFLALETTGDLQFSVLILAAATLVSVIVRRSFGYSFATWRLHLRGESIKSAQDIGWMRGLTVQRLMRAQVETVPATMTIAEFTRAHPLSSAYWVIATGPTGGYAGMVSITEAHGAAAETGRGAQPLLGLLRDQETTLTPGMNIREAARLFESSESEALAVTTGDAAKTVVGFLAEATLLRRYAEELDKARQDLSGESWIGER